MMGTSFVSSVPLSTSGRDLRRVEGRRRGAVWCKAEGSTVEGKIQCRFPEVERIVAIGDLHGDLYATMRALRAANLITPDGNWIGGNTNLVQVGDVLDRGNQEIAILELLWSLKEEAQAQGGDVHMTLGNHELLNVALDFKFVSEGGFSDFQDAVFDDSTPMSDEVRSKFESLPENAKQRAVALRPGGDIAVRLADCNLVLQIGRNVFVHGGLTTKHVRAFGSIEAINERVRGWLLGKMPEPRWILRASESPVWMRDYSTYQRLFSASNTCKELEKTLNMMEADRMVVGHTPHEFGANCACGNQIWRIDTGMSFSYSGKPEVLEIKGDDVNVLTEKGSVRAALRSL
ncbi:hypothetical protein NDN08_006484 [Rhodosorus marinus]|uniref:Calcineurin-like phosphoesterase domain-containing protein n=1 Tax=Rhodosorus marinus TaxID=101924 RepID=A0AAV8UHV6_9RHOD|nr:hypothetical protein NDN08_006484 [Rhodosorus marinus]